MSEHARTEVKIEQGDFCGLAERFGEDKHWDVYIDGGSVSCSDDGMVSFASSDLPALIRLLQALAKEIEKNENP